MDKVLASERIDRKERLRKARMTVGEGASVSDAFKVFKGAVVVLSSKRSEKWMCMVDI